ncbi:MAG: DUF916 domain-containing protein [Burkholderiaceae bacterium]|nr:DUF916 domain-containing protein [Microbacteriaceae bacterium]
MRARPRGARRAVLAAALLAALFTAAVPQQAAAIDDGTLGIRPSNESDFFHLSVLPGEHLDAVAIVTNHTAEPVTLLTYPVDGTSTASGAFALEAESDGRDQIGAWAILDATEVTVPAESEVEVPFRLTVPTGTRAGDYAGALIIQSPPVEGETTAESGTPMRIDVVQRQGVRIYLTVPGEAVEALDTGDLTWSRDGDDITLTLPVTNAGNTTLFPTATATIDRWFTAPSSVDFLTPESVLPGATITLTATLVIADVVQIGTAHATVTSAAGIDTASAPFFSVPWPVVAGVIVGLFALAYALSRTVRFVRTARRAIAQVAAAAPPPSFVE